MKDVNCPLISQGVHRSERVTAKILDDFHNSSTPKAAQRFRIAMLAAPLRNVQGLAHVVLDWLRKRAQILAARSNPYYRLQQWFIGHRQTDYSDITISLSRL